MAIDDKQTQGDNIIPNTQTPINSHSRFSKKMVIGILVLFLIVVLAFGGMMYWLSRNTATPTENGQQQNSTTTQVQGSRNVQAIADAANKILPASTLTFPEVVTLSPVATSTVPQEVKDLVLSGSTSEAYNTFTYKPPQPGYQVSYVLTNTMIEDVVKQMNNKLLTLGREWRLLGSTTRSPFAFTDVQGMASSTQARITYFQEGNSVKVIVQTSTKPKK